ncbi:MAG: hypothetical protein ACUVQP_00025 [Bacteroidales bacterium]
MIPWQDLLASLSILAGAFLAGRYFGLLEARIRNGNGKRNTEQELARKLEQLVEELHLLTHGKRGRSKETM